MDVVESLKVHSRIVECMMNIKTPTNKGDVLMWLLITNLQEEFIA